MPPPPFPLFIPLKEENAFNGLSTHGINLSLYIFEI